MGGQRKWFGCIFSHLEIEANIVQSLLMPAVAQAIGTNTSFLDGQNTNPAKINTYI